MIVNLDVGQDMEASVDAHFDGLLRDMSASAHRAAFYMSSKSPVYKGVLRDSWQVETGRELIEVTGKEYWQDLNDGVPAGFNYGPEDYAGLAEWFEGKLNLADGTGPATRTISKWKRFGREGKHLVDMAPDSELWDLMLSWF